MRTWWRQLTIDAAVCVVVQRYRSLTLVPAAASVVPTPCGADAAADKSRMVTMRLSVSSAIWRLVQAMNSKSTAAEMGRGKWYNVGSGVDRCYVCVCVWWWWWWGGGARFVHRCHLDFVVTPGSLRNWQQ